MRPPLRRVGQRTPAAIARPPSFPDNVGDNQPAWLPRWQNLNNPHEEKFVGGYSVYPGGGCTEYPWYAVQAEGFGSAYKREVRRRYPSPVSFTIQAPSLPSPDELPRPRSRGDRPLWDAGARLHFKWDENVLQMWEHSKQVIAELIRAAGGVYEAPRSNPTCPAGACTKWGPAGWATTRSTS